MPLKPNRLYYRNCEKGIKQIETNSIDNIITDPDYGYNFMGTEEKWGGLPKTSVWKEALRVLKPGAFAFIFSAPRQDVLSEMINRLKKAGFVITFSPIYWAYAQGFTKALNISKAIDKKPFASKIKEFKIWLKQKIQSSGMKTAEINELCGFTATSYTRIDGKDYWTSAIPSIKKYKKMKEILHLPTDYDWIVKNYTKERGYIEITGGLHGESANIQFSGKQLSETPYSEKAKEFYGAYAGFQPKPAVEVIIVCMKPLSEKTYVEQALKNRKGVTWLGDCRIPTPNTDDIGRFTANLLVSGDVLNDKKDHHSSGKYTLGINDKGGTGTVYQIPHRKGIRRGFTDKGSFSRFFDLDLWYEHKILKNVRKLPKSVQNTFPFMIVAKPSQKEKWFWCKICEIAEHNNKKHRHNQHLFYCPTCDCNFGDVQKKKHEKHKTDSNLISHITQKPRNIINYLLYLGSREGDVILDLYMGSGTVPEQSYWLRRKYIAFDNDPIAFAIASARMKPTKAQQRLDLFSY